MAASVAPQARGEDAWSSAVPGVYQRVAGQQVGEYSVAAATAQRMAEHEHIAPAQPGETDPGQFMAQALLNVEIVAKVQLDRLKSEAGQRGKLAFDAIAANVRRRVVHGVRDHHRAAAAVTDEFRQAFWMVAHSKR